MNTSKKLGLPIEYQQMPEYFDAHNTDKNTEVKNALIEKLLRKQEVKTVLDMTCGTGSQVFYLAQRGYETTGSDFSPALLDIARDKAKKMNRTITFIDGDMRDLNAGKFDAVITIFNAIGHLVQSDFEVALKNIYSNLKENGIYIFDIFNLDALTEEAVKDFMIESDVNGVKIQNKQHSEIDRVNGFLISHDQYTIFKNANKPENYTNTFSLKIYTAKELTEILNRNGFEVIAQYDMDGNPFVAEKSVNILTVARKKQVSNESN